MLGIDSEYCVCGLTYGNVVTMINATIDKPADIIHVVVGRALQGSGAISAVLMAFLADFVAEGQRSKANALLCASITISCVSRG
jgi:predicted MFS family arabinose efflux permease